MTGPASSIPDRQAVAAANMLAEVTGVGRHDVLIVLGSGWQAAAAALGRPTMTMAASMLPGFAAPAAQGHQNLVSTVELAGQRVLIFLGRSHLYEGHAAAQIVRPIRTACAAGVKSVILTNAAGAVNRELAIGRPVLISDHINLTGKSPLVGGQFVDMTDAYSPRLRDLARRIDPAIADGVYACLPGPQYETPAEIAMLSRLGADLVGMSTVPETIAARAEGVDVLGISLVTNLAAGVSPQPLSHADVLATGQASAARLGSLLREIVVGIGDA